MLKLSRNDGESITIYPSEELDPSMTIGELFQDGPITVTVRGRRTMLVIDAPDHLKILRGELVTANQE